MAGDKTVEVPGSEWTRISDEPAGGNFAVQIHHPGGGYIAFSSGVEAPTEEQARWAVEGRGGFSESVETLAAGAANFYIWVKPSGSGLINVSLSYA